MDGIHLDLARCYGFMSYGYDWIGDTDRAMKMKKKEIKVFKQLRKDESLPWLTDDLKTLQIKAQTQKQESLKEGRKGMKDQHLLKALKREGTNQLERPKSQIPDAEIKIE